MKVSKQELLKAAKELVSVLGLVNNQTEKIPVEVNSDNTEEELKTLIVKCVPLIEPTDNITADTEDVIQQLTTGGEDADTTTTLEDEIQQADTLKELRNIAKLNEAFKSIRGKLMTYKEVEILKGEMLDLLNPDEVVDKIIEEKTVVDAPQNVSKELSAESNTIASKRMKVSEIKTKEVFQALFKIDEVTKEMIKKSILEDGYDEAFPLVLWGDILVDGHTRLAAVKELGLTEVPVEQKQFSGEHEAVEYAIHNQRDRRNLTDSELLAFVEAVDEKMSKVEAGAKGGNKEEKTEDTATKTAKKLKVSKSKVQEARAVLTDKQATKDVKSGKKSLHKAATEVREKKVKKVEKIMPEKTRTEAVCQVMREKFAGADVSLAEIASEADILYQNCGGEMSLTQSASVVDMVVDILIAYDVVVRLNEKEISINDIWR